MSRASVDVITCNSKNRGEEPHGDYIDDDEDNDHDGIYNDINMPVETKSCPGGAVDENHIASIAPDDQDNNDCYEDMCNDLNGSFLFED